MLDAKMLVTGKYHEEEEEDDEVKGPDQEPQFFTQAFADVQHQKRL